MKKLLIASFVFFSSIEILFAGDGCQNKDYAYIDKSKPKIVFTSNNLQLLKYTDKNGTTKFAIKNHDGTVLAENLSRVELRNDFPEIEKQYES